ncbi:hypothetical protein Daus18300_004046 [Diaporthe australafricana]|uniref:Glycosyltransferase family 32 protein n=1 Tax=Diaporthe australafricana TaxID=127596 RepID=A0ABR3XBD7_9PEZI
MTDESAHAFVNEKFANHPEIVETYNSLAVPILRADLLRYLLLYAEGGVWFDLDASCEGTPIDEWVPDQYREDASLVVGWEFDGGYHFEFERQFVTWTVLAKKGSPHLMVVVEDILTKIREVALANNVSISGVRMNMIKDVVDFTGPKQFARSVMRELEKTLGEKGKWNGWDEYHEILEPKMAGDVLIIPGYSFAASYNNYEPEDQHRVKPSLVVHHYAGTWKNEYGGEIAQS